MKLTIREKARQKRRKQLIDTVQRASLECANALTELLDGEYWKDTHTSWIEFCKETFQFSKTRMYQLMDATRVISELPEGLRPLITNERQARVLSDVSESQRIKIINRAKQQDRGTGITAELLKAARDFIVRPNVTTPVTTTKNYGRQEKSTTVDYRGSVKTGAKTVPEPPKTNVTNGVTHDPKKKVPKVLVYDEFGEIIPDEALPFWKRRDEVQGLMKIVSDLKKTLKEAKDSEDQLYYRMSNGVIMDCANLHAAISEAKPYAVCTTCMGFPSAQPQGCHTCGSRGVISKFQWDTQSPKEVKEMRLKAIADRNQNV
jgi:hypothetical protein